MVIGVIALIVIGPERLPKVARTVGHLLGRAQRYVNDVKSDIRREIELDELRKFKTDMETAAQSVQTSLRDAETSCASPAQARCRQELDEAAKAAHQRSLHAGGCHGRTDRTARDRRSRRCGADPVPTPTVPASTEPASTAPASVAPATPAAVDAAPKSQTPTGNAQREPGTATRRRTAGRQLHVPPGRAAHAPVARRGRHRRRFRRPVLFPRRGQDLRPAGPPHAGIAAGRHPHDRHRRHHAASWCPSKSR